MTVRMPHDAVDSEVYIRTPRGHSGILMDPWTSSTWRKKWSNYHTPCKVTKEKLNRFNQERTHQHISLHKTAGRHKQFRNSYWSPRPNRKQNLHAYGLIADNPSARQHQLNRVRHRSISGMEKSPRKRIREMSPTGSFADPVIVNNSDKETETTDEDHQDDLSFPVST